MLRYLAPTGAIDDGGPLGADALIIAASSSQLVTVGNWTIAVSVAGQFSPGGSAAGAVAVVDGPGDTGIPGAVDAGLGCPAPVGTVCTPIDNVRPKIAMTCAMDAPPQ